MLYDQATIDLKVTFALLVDLSICLNSNVFISNANGNKKLDHIYQHNQYIKKKKKWWKESVQFQRKIYTEWETQAVQWKSSPPLNKN